MVTKLFAVYDSKAEFFSPPFMHKSTGEALRDFIAAANDKQTKIGVYPADFTIFEIGTYNDSTAEVKMLEAKIAHGTALELKNQKSAEA